MNTIYKVIWNARCALWQCVSEVTRGRGKTSTRTRAARSKLRSPEGHTLRQAALSAFLTSLGLVTSNALALCSPSTPGECYAITSQPLSGYPTLNVGSGFIVSEGSVVTTPGYNIDFTQSGGYSTIAGDWLVVKSVPTYGQTLRFRSSSSSSEAPIASQITITPTGVLRVGGAGFYNRETDTYNETLNTYSGHIDLTNGAGQAVTLDVQGKLIVEQVLAGVNDGSRNNQTLNLMISSGGEVKAAGLKLGAGSAGSVTDSRFDVAINGGTLRLTTQRGLVSAKSWAYDATTQVLRNPIQSTINLNGGEVIIADPPAEARYYANGNTESSVLFSDLVTRPSATALGITVENNRYDAVNILSDTTLNITATKKVIMQSALAGFSGAGTLIKRGAGTLLLNADNSAMTGGLRVEEGRVVFGGFQLNDTTGETTTGSDTAVNRLYTTSIRGVGQSAVGLNTNRFKLMQGALVVNNDAWIEFSPDVSIGPVTVANTLSGTGNLRLAGGSATVRFTGENTVTGEIEIRSGTWLLEGASARLEGAQKVDLQTGYFTIQDGASAQVGNITFGSVANQYAWITVDNATLKVGNITHAPGVNSNGRLVVQNGGTLEFDATGHTQANPLMLAEGFNPDTDKVESLRSMGNNAAYNYLKVTGGVAKQNPEMRVTGSLPLQKVGDGRLIVTAHNQVSNPQGNDYASWSVREGVLQIGDNQVLNGNSEVYLNGSGNLYVSADGTLDENGVSSATVAWGNSDYFALPVSWLQGGHGNLEMAGTGTLILGSEGNSRVYQYDGVTRIRSGVLSVQDNQSNHYDRLETVLGSSTSAIDTGEGEAKGTLEFRTFNADKAFSRSITGTGGLRKAGTRKVTLTADTYDYTGKTEVRGGELYLADGKAITQTSQLAVGAENPDSSATFTLEGSAYVKGDVLLAQGAQGNTVNTLMLDGATLAAHNILRGEGTGANNAIRLVGKEGARVEFTRPEDVPETQLVTKALFDQFDTSAGDVIAVGDNGMTVAIAKNLRMVQDASAAISDEAGASNTTLRVEGPGTLVMAAKNTYTGALTIDGATLEWGNGGSSADADVGGSDAITLTNGGTLAINLADTDFHFVDSRSQLRLVTGNGNLVQKGTGTTIIDQAHTYDGTTTILGGTLRLVMETGKLGSDATKAVVTGVGTDKGTFELSNADTATPQTFTRRVTGTGNLRKVGAGSVTLDTEGVPFDYTGDTRVSDGTLVLDTGNHITQTQNLVVSAEGEGVTDARFTLKGTATVNDAVKLADDVSNAGATNTLQLDGSTLHAGRIIANRTETNASARVRLEMQHAATVELTQTGELFAGFNTATGDAIEVGDGGATFAVAEGKTVTQSANAAISDMQEAAIDPTTHHLTKAGSGTLVMNARNTYSGRLTVADGVLQLGDETTAAGSALLGGTGDIALTGGTLRLALTNAPGAVATPTDGERVNARGAYVLARRLTGSDTQAAQGSLVKAGAGRTILTAVNDYQGSTTIEAGVLQVGDVAEGSTSATATLGGTGDIMLSTSTSRLAYSLTDDLTLTRKLTGAGGIEQSGTGTLTINNATNDFTGNVYINSGRLKVTDLSSLGVKDATSAADTTDTADSADSATPNARRVRRALADRVATPTERSIVFAESPLDASGVRDFVFEGFTEPQRFTLNTTGVGNVRLRGTGAFQFLANQTYAHEGETTLAGGATYDWEKGVALANSTVRVEDATLQLHPTTADQPHDVRSFAMTSAGNVRIEAHNLAEFSRIRASEAIGVGGGTLFVSVGEYDVAENFSGDRLEKVIYTTKAGAPTVPTAEQFGAYDDDSLLFNFIPVYDHAGEIDLIISSETSDICSSGEMGELECIVRQFDHEHAAPMAEVLDHEFSEHPGSVVSQYFYSIADQAEADRTAVAALPLMTGSLNSILTNESRALALYAPRDPCDPSVTENGTNLWVKLDQFYDRQDALKGSTGYRSRNSAFAVGSDVCVRDNQTRLGVMVGFTDADITSHGNIVNHTAEVRQYQVGVYGDHHMTENQDVDFSLGYARGLVEGKRHLYRLKKHANSSYQSDLVYAGVGYNWRGEVVSPFVRFDYTYLRSAGYHEWGATVFNYDVKAQTRHSGLVQVGYQFKAQPAKALTLEGRVALGAEVLDKENRIEAAFEGIPGAYFTTRSAEDSRLMGLFDLGLNYQATDALSMRLKYHLTYQPDFRSHGGEVEVKYTF